MRRGLELRSLEVTRYVVLRCFLCLCRNIDHTIQYFRHLKVYLHLDASAAHFEQVLTTLLRPAIGVELRCRWPTIADLRHIVHLLLELRPLPLLLSLLPPLSDLSRLAVLLVDLLLHPLQRLFLLLLPVGVLFLLMEAEVRGLAEDFLGPLVDGLLRSSCLLLLELPLSSLLFLLLFLFSLGALLLALELFLNLLVVLLHYLELVELLRDHCRFGDEDRA